MRRTLKFTSCLLLFIASASTALAHPSHLAVDNSLYNGLIHPLIGIDHLIAMLAMGIWASNFALKQSMRMLSAFFALLLGGFTLGLSSGVGFSFMETGIVLTSVFTGLLIAFSKNVNKGIAISLAASFAVFHGFAHGIETASVVPSLFALGFILTSVALVSTGFLISKLLSRKTPAAVRFIGLGIAVLGVSLFSLLEKNHLNSLAS